jgi:hypothetical protein
MIRGGRVGRALPNFPETVGLAEELRELVPVEAANFASSLEELTISTICIE